MTHKEKLFLKHLLHKATYLQQQEWTGAVKQVCKSCPPPRRAIAPGWPALSRRWLGTLGGWALLTAWGEVGRPIPSLAGSLPQQALLPYASSLCWSGPSGGTVTPGSSGLNYQYAPVQYSEQYSTIYEHTKFPWVHFHCCRQLPMTGHMERSLLGSQYPCSGTVVKVSRLEWREPTRWKMVPPSFKGSCVHRPERKSNFTSLPLLTLAPPSHTCAAVLQYRSRNPWNDPSGDRTAETTPSVHRIVGYCPSLLIVSICC